MSDVKRRLKGSQKDQQTPRPKPADENDDTREKEGDHLPFLRECFQTLGQQLPLRVFSRIVIITSLLIIVYFNSDKGKKLVTFAKQSETLSGKGLRVECSTEYTKEVFEYKDCMPKNCGRFVSDSIVTAKEAETLLSVARKGLQLGGSSGGASILDLHSGALSVNEKFVNIYKIERAKEIFTEQDFITYRVVKDKIKYAIAHYFGVSPEKIFLTHPTFFSQITPKPAKTVHDEYWHPHVDKETYKSFHYTSLLYLSEYEKDFRGGRFVFIDKNTNSTIEPRKARVSMFTSGSENTHFVEKVSSGVRFAATISFTCNEQYAISDPEINKFKTY